MKFENKNNIIGISFEIEDNLFETSKFRDENLEFLFLKKTDKNLIKINFISNIMLIMI